MAKQSVRNRLLDAAVQTLHERGFNGCGVQDITDAAGVPKGSFYSHFDSKEALGAAALDRYWENRSCALLRGLSEDTLPPLARLRRYFSQLGEELAERDYTGGCLIGNLSAELSDQSRLVCDRLSSVFAGWTGRCSAVCATGNERARSAPTSMPPCSPASSSAPGRSGTPGPSRQGWHRPSPVRRGRVPRDMRVGKTTGHL